MTPPILITGGTGSLGRLVVPRLVSGGERVRILSRSSVPSSDGVEYAVGDLSTGEGLEAATRDVETVLHLAGAAKGDDVLARHLVSAARHVRHLVYISVVGAERIPIRSAVDRIMFGYFGFKRAAELIIEQSGIPFTTLRATQFHELNLAAVRAMAKLPLVPMPAGIRFQPIEGDEVAARLVQLVLGEPSGLVADVGGPRAYTLTELMRSYLAATGRRRPIVQIHVPGTAAAALRAGANLTPEHAVGRRTWEEFLIERAKKAG